MNDGEYINYMAMKELDEAFKNELAGKPSSWKPKKKGTNGMNPGELSGADGLEALDLS
jgi:hypothetical protein